MTIQIKCISINAHSNELCSKFIFVAYHVEWLSNFLACNVERKTYGLIDVTPR